MFLRTLLLCLASLSAHAHAQDWVAWTGNERHGTAQSGQGWRKVPRADDFQKMDWESPGGSQRNAYRFYYPGATHYTLGAENSGNFILDFWQPFDENIDDAAVGANIRAALYGLYAKQTHILVNVSNVGWSGIAAKPICEEGAVCPIAMLMGTSNLPKRVAEGKILPLDKYFTRYLVEHLKRLPDKFLSMIYYDYNLFDHWMGVPFLSDTRVLGFNKTTFRRLGLQLPPPHGRFDWTWDDVRQAACNITYEYGEAGFVANSGWDDDAKLFMLMVQAAGGALFRAPLDPRSARRCDLQKGRSLVESFWKPMIRNKCLKGFGANYWGNPSEKDLESLLKKDVDPRRPPPVSSFSQKSILAHSGGSDWQAMGLFMSNGVDEELLYGRCGPEQGLAEGKRGGCGRLWSGPGCKALNSRLVRTTAECREWATRQEGNTFAFSPLCNTFDSSSASLGQAEQAEELQCEVFTCRSAANLTAFFHGLPAGSVFSKYCGEIEYATMPNNLTFMGGSGLALPKHIGDDQECLSQLGSPSHNWTWLESGEAPPPCWKHVEGWRVVSELISPDRPFMRQANTLKAPRMPPPLKDLSAFETELWRPAVDALSNAIPSQYPNMPIPEYADLESLKPIRIALLRSTHGNTNAAESLQEACDIVDEVLRRCNRSRWKEDPRCVNIRDGLPGCPAGSRFTVGAFGQLGCEECPAGRYLEQRSVAQECKPCTSGSFSSISGSMSCAACPAGTVAPTDGLLECTPCPSGRAPADMGCSKCPQTTFEQDGTCWKCPSGKTSSEESAGIHACTRRPELVVLNVLLVLLLTCLSLLLPMLFGRPMPIQDIFSDEGCLVVKTWGGHRILKWCPVPIHIQLKGTQHAKVENKIFSAKKRDSDELWLLDSNGAHIMEDVHCSRGSLRVLARSSFFASSILKIPVGLAAALLCTLAGIIVWQMAENADAEFDMLPYLLVFLLVCLATSSLVYWYVWTRSFRTPLDRKRTQWRQKLLRRQNIGACERGPGRAIMAGKLLDFHDYFSDAIGKRDMYYVVTNLLMPLTKPERLSYAELAGPSNVQWFVSHCWNNCFADLVESLRRLALSLAEADAFIYPVWHEVSFWICSFSNNQWQLDEELGRGDPMESSFNKALGSPTCKGTAMVLDENAEALRRSWCLFEVFQTCKLIAERSHYDGLLMCTPAGVLQKGDASVDIVVVLARTLSKIRMEDATATKSEDKIMIDTCVQSLEGGFAAVNRFVRRCIKDALEEAHGSFEGHFRALVSALDGNLAPAPSLLGRRPSLFDPASKMISLPSSLNVSESTTDTITP